MKIIEFRKGDNLNRIIGREYLQIQRQGFKIRIIKQKYRGEKFGVDGSDVFESKNNFSFYSYAYPALHATGLYVLGSNKTKDDSVVMFDDLCWWNRLCIAVAEYNHVRGQYEG